MITYANISDGTKIVEQVPCAQYQFNPITVLAIVGTDREPEFEPDGENVVLWNCIGFLSEQSFMLQIQIKNSLHIDGWDFEKYPNPLVCLGDTQFNQEGDSQ